MSYALQTAVTPLGKMQAFRDQIAYHLTLIKRSSLCHDREPKDIERILVYLQGRTAHNDRKDFLFRTGNMAAYLGFVLGGAARVQREGIIDYYNNTFEILQRDSDV